MAAKGMRTTKLKDVCDRITVGHVGSMSDKYTAEGVPFLRSQNIMAFRLNVDDIKFIPSDFHEKLRKSALHPGDVAVVRTGNPGTACVIPTTFTELNCADLVVITPSKELNPYYLAAIFNSAWGVASVAGNLVGVAQQHFNIGAARELEVSLPARSAQDRIAGILSAYDELIENSQRRIKILESMARALYREWFVHFRFPGHEHHPRVPSPLGEIPKGWEVRKLGDLIGIDKGVSYNGAGLTEDGNPMVNLKNILAGGGFRRDATKPYSGDFKPRHTVKHGDIILANTDLTQAGNVVASAALVPRLAADRPILISHHLFAIRLPERIPAAFIYHLLLEDAFRGFAKGFAIGTTVLGLPKEGVLNFVFAFPPEDLIMEFSKHVAPSHQLIETILERIDNLRRTRDLLLPRLLSGQIDVEAIAS